MESATQHPIDHNGSLAACSLASLVAAISMIPSRAERKNWKWMVTRAITMPANSSDTDLEVKQRLKVIEPIITDKVLGEKFRRRSESISKSR